MNLATSITTKILLALAGLMFIAYLASCTSVKTVYLMGGLKETDMELTACWVQPPKSDLWYPCQSESVKDKECLNLYETLMQAVEHQDQIQAGQLEPDTSPTDVAKLWERTKETCFVEKRRVAIPHVN